MKKYKIKIEYDGTNFSGWQRQDSVTSVQGIIEKSVLKITGKKILCEGAGRTDKGVHAIGQIGHFILDTCLSPLRLREAINHYVRPHGISIINLEEAPSGFHARFSAIARVYKYRVLNRRAHSSLEENRVWHVKQKLDLHAMHEAAQYFIGYHNFNAFRSRECQSASSSRTLDYFNVIQHEEEIQFFIQSRSFLHNQVRIMIGTLVQVGLHKKEPQWIEYLLKQGDRTKAGLTAPAHGLYLIEVKYEDC